MTLQNAKIKIFKLTNCIVYTLHFTTDFEYDTS